MVLLVLCACQEHNGDVPSPLDEIPLPPQYELVSGDSSPINYTPWYIHSFGIEGPEGTGIGGGGSNVEPAHEDGRSSEGGWMCCTSVPAVWQPELRLTVRWLVDKKLDGKTPGYWYKAENVRLAKYGELMGNIWTIFLPGDRVRIMVSDGNLEGGNNANNRPADNDPYIAQGEIDHEWNRLYRRGGDTP
ncbi:DUF3304 domain-containing protein [Paraburkholderia hayleyella]|uniref:DUF3304 domain-containing protein n=1 Tax=Paraburkholderia hayleyella TaxID=2152889 RepID=UPI0031B5DC35